MFERFERLNALGRLNNARQYLEIGVARGATFNRVSVPVKIGVDPNFLFNTSLYANHSTHFYKTSSDDFFSRNAIAYRPFDLIYLDGLHTFEQTFRDFCSSLSFSHNRTLWLLDDTCPDSLAAADPSLNRAIFLRKQLNINNESWMGDVFKVVCAIHDFFPPISYATFPAHGQTVLWFFPRTDFHPKWNSLKTISELTFADFLELSDTIFERKSAEEIFGLIRSSFRLDRNLSEFSVSV